MNAAVSENDHFIAPGPVRVSCVCVSFLMGPVSLLIFFTTITSSRFNLSLSRLFSFARFRDTVLFSSVSHRQDNCDY